MIPARGGSVSIPKKNIKPLAGRPLIDWVIRPALDSGIFDEVWVSTDDDGIAEVALQCGAKVHRRAPETATATASTESAIKDFVDAHPAYDYLCLIQATSPLLTPTDFIEGIKLMQETGADSLVTAVRFHRFLWSVDPKTKEAKVVMRRSNHRTHLLPGATCLQARRARRQARALSLAHSRTHAHTHTRTHASAYPDARSADVRFRCAREWLAACERRLACACSCASGQS